MSREPKPADEPAAQGSATDPTSLPATTPAALHDAGFKHLKEGRPLDAQVCCLQALSIQPEHADTLHLMGLLSLQGPARPCGGMAHPRHPERSPDRLSLDTWYHAEADGAARGSPASVRQGGAAQAC